MCGIVGGIGKNSFQIIRDNLSLLSQRGPDSCGVLELDNGLTMGATRLAMTDPLDRSNQPFVDIETGNVIVFNGEIYNFKSIRNILALKNVTFMTESDTEVVLKSLALFGTDFISKFEGMFSFAYFDKQKSAIVLARDFLGKKPLYYSISKSGFSFSSQVNLVKKFLEKTTLNLNSVAMYLGLGYLIDPITMFNEINSVEPGEIITFNMTLNRIESREKFVPESISDPKGETISDSLDIAIKERTDGHESFALSLSGGIDSNLILIKCLELGLNVMPFTMRWPNSDKLKYNLDVQAAINVTKALGIKLNIIEMPNVNLIPSILIDYAKSISSPNSNPTAISMMHLYSEIQKMGHRLVLTGDGGDEIFGGYQRYQVSAKTNILPKLDSGVLNKIVLGQSLKHSFISKVAYAITPNNTIESWLYWHLLANEYMVSKICKGLPGIEISLLNSDLERIYRGKGNGVKHIMFNDLKTWLPMESNRRLDSISMRYSIEARSPFQAERIIGNGYKQMQKFDFKFINKELLTESFPKLGSLPINKGKLGFISPLGSWLRSNPELINSSLQNLNSYLDLDTKKVQELIKSPNNGDYFGFKTLWNLIVLEKWLYEHY